MINTDERLVRAESLLREFCGDVGAVGLERNEDGYASPVGSDGWSDIGKTYIDACEFLGLTPVWADPDEAGPWGEADDA